FKWSHGSGRRSRSHYVPAPGAQLDRRALSGARRRLESMKGRPMTNSHSSSLLDPTSSAESAARAERELNTAIVSADISASYEEFLAIVDRFYADDVELRSDSSPEVLIGRARLKSLLMGFLVPVHVMAEIGGLSVSVREKPIAGDSRDEQHSQWSLELVGETGRAVRVGWSVRRRWKESRVVGEYHYDHQQDGEALGTGDLRIPTFSGTEETD